MLIDGDDVSRAKLSGTDHIMSLFSNMSLNGLSSKISDYLLEQSSLMTFSAKCFGVPTMILLDCGATREYIDREYAVKHGFEISPLMSPFAVSLANGSKLSCSSYVKNCKTEFKQFSHVCDLYVLELAGEHEIIFGQFFLWSQNPVIDW